MMRKMTILLSLVLACSAFAEEEARLQANWELLQKHKIELLPAPKFLEFGAARPVQRLVLSGLPEAKYRTAIAEEMESRLAEINSPIKLEFADKPAPGAFNLILEAWDENSAEAKKIPFNEDSRFEQAYTLTPVSNGIVLRGKGDLGLLYAAVTMRALIARGENGVQLYPAAVSDWPDFALRRVGMRFNMFGQPRTNDPEQCLPIMQQVVKWALRRKINAFADMPYTPYSPDIVRLNAKPPYYDAKAAALMKQVTDYARANGILAGRTSGAIGIANISYEEDAADPRFKGMVMYSRRLATWAHLDWHREINLRHADFIKASGFAFANHHSVDSGGPNDPELWSRRDPATRELYGDDRVKANLALWKTVRECFQGTGVEMSISQYPYVGCYLTNDGVRQTLKLANTPAARETAGKVAQRNIDYLKQLDSGLPKDIVFTLREGTADEMKAFYDAVPQRPIKVYWEARNSNRDVVPLLNPEIAMVKSSFATPRKADLKLWLSDDYEFWDQSKALFAEFSWNRNFPGSRDFSREDSPIGYPTDFLRTLARRAAEGLWGMTYGPRLTPLFEDLTSLAYAYDPIGFSKQRVHTKIDEPAYLKRNREALQRAEKAADAVFAEVSSSPAKQQLFSPGSYPYLLDLLRMLKGARFYTTVHQAVSELESLAKSGKMKECEDFYAKATAQLKAMEQEYRLSMAALDQAPTRTDFSSYGKWSLETSNFRFVNLLSPNMAVLQKQLDDAFGKRQSLFALYNVPDWYSQYNRYYFFKRLVAGPEDYTWKHFFGHKIFNLAPNPVEFRLRRAKDGLVFSGAIIQPKPEAYSGKAVSFREWPKGDSAGIHLLPSGSTTALQVVVGSSGGAFVCRHTTAENGISTSTPCDLNLNPDVKRTPSGWEFSLEIPFSVLNAEPGKDWKALFEYNENNTPYASAFADGKRFPDSSFWQTLVFSTQPAWQADILLNSGEVSLKDQTHATGSGTLVTFQPRLETTSPVFVKSFTAIIRDAYGQALSEPLQLTENRFVPLCWSPDAPLGVQLDVSHPGIAIELTAAYQEDGVEKQAVRTLFAGKIAIKGTPLPDGTPTMRTPFIRSEKLTQKQGTLSFTLQPDWNFSQFAPPVHKCLFHAGPQLQPGNFNWRSAMLIRYNPRFQRFYFTLTNKVRNTLIVSGSPENWDGKSPLEIAVSWNMTGEKPQMALSFNGIKAADTPKTWDDKELQVRFVPDELPYPLSFGALNSGDDSADGTIGKVKIKAQEN